MGMKESEMRIREGEGKGGLRDWGKVVHGFRLKVKVRRGDGFGGP